MIIRFRFIAILEQMNMALELKIKVYDVEEQEDKGSNPRQDQDIIVHFRRRSSRGKRGGNEERGGCDDHQRGHDAGDVHVEPQVILATFLAITGGKEAATKDLPTSLTSRRKELRLRGSPY